jgi:hypothetical protein
MRSNLLVACQLIPIALLGCAGPAPTVAQNQVAARPPASTGCDFPDAPGAPAPEWICAPIAEGAEISAVGVYEKTAAGIGFQQDHAESAARANLARQMQTRVMNMLKDFANTTGAASSETVDKANGTVSNSFAAEDLVGARIYRTKVSPNGTMYVLVGVDPNSAARTLKQATAKAVKSSKGNENALWQKFQADKAQEELKGRSAAEDVKKAQ